MQNICLIRSSSLFTYLRHCFSIAAADFIDGVRSIKWQGKTCRSAFITLIIRRRGEKIVKMWKYIVTRELLYVNYQVLIKILKPIPHKHQRCSRTRCSFKALLIANTAMNPRSLRSSAPAHGWWEKPLKTESELNLHPLWLININRGKGF